MYGHLWVHKHLDGLTEEQCLASNVCGVWSVKDIIAHLASFEWVLADVLSSCSKPGPTPALDAFINMDGDSYNAVEVGRRKEKSMAEVTRDYDDGYEKVMSILPQIPENDMRQPGNIPWYGSQYSIEDLIVYQYYGHKREHCAQIAVYRDQLKQM
jgi:hypothetical protein